MGIVVWSKPRRKVEFHLGLRDRLTEAHLRYNLHVSAKGFTLQGRSRCTAPDADIETPRTLGSAPSVGIRFRMTPQRASSPRRSRTRPARRSMYLWTNFNRIRLSW